MKVFKLSNWSHDPMQIWSLKNVYRQKKNAWEPPIYLAAEIVAILDIFNGIITGLDKQNY